MNKFSVKELIAAVLLIGSISASQAGVVLDGSYESNNSFDGNINPLAEGDNSSATVEFGSIIGDVQIPGDVTNNTSVNGSITPLAKGDGSCASVRVGVISNQAACGGNQVADGGNQGGGNILGDIGNAIKDPLGTVLYVFFELLYAGVNALKSKKVLTVLQKNFYLSTS